MREQNGSNPAERKSYSTPLLVCHGLVAELTRFPGRTIKPVRDGGGGPWVLPDGTIITPS